MTAQPAAAPTAPAAGASLGVLLRDRGALMAGAVLLTLTAMAWVAVVMQAADMGGAMLPGGVGSLGEAAMFAAMWGVMMAAMMLPSAVPMIALYGLVRRGERAIPTSLFAGTYLAVWLLIGLPVYAASVGVAAIGATDAGMWLPYALAAVLVAAGAYQLTGIKRVCLRYCQGPLDFLMGRWRAGYVNTLRLGLAHAAYCVGCCWGLMVILVAAGAMSLPWVLPISAVVFAEKVLPRGEWTARAVGVGLMALGVAVGVWPELAVALRGGVTEMAPMGEMGRMRM